MYNIDGGILDTLMSDIFKVTECSHVTPKTVNHLIDFFNAICKCTLDIDAASVISTLESQTSVKISCPARCVAQILFNNSSMASTYQKKYLKAIESNDTSEVQRSTILLGEIGRMKDLSSISSIIETIDSLFKSDDSDVKLAASICLGNISIGNISFFLPIVMKLITGTSVPYLELISVREIISNCQDDLSMNLDELLDILFTQSHSDHENIRNVTSECLGRLYIKYAEKMNEELDEQIKKGNSEVNSTIAKALKYSVSPETDAMFLEEYIPTFIETLTNDEVPVVRQYALESLIQVAHNMPSLIRHEVPSLQKKLFHETEFKKELIKEVDLGPFKHKTDIGKPIRKAGLQLLETLIEKCGDKIDVPTVSDITRRGLDDPDEDCVTQSQQILIKLIDTAPGSILGQITQVIDSLSTIIEKQKKKKGEPSNLLRMSLRCVECLNKLEEATSNQKFQEFLSSLLADEELKKFFEI